MILNADQRKAVSRRLVKLPHETTILSNTSFNLNGAANSYTEATSANEAFLQQWIDIANAYAVEQQNISGEVTGNGTGDWNTFVSITVAETRNYPPYSNYNSPAIGDKFFPWDPANPVEPDTNFFVAPQINKWTAGKPSSITGNCEQVHVNAYLALTNYLQFGWGVAGGAVVQTTVTVQYNAGDAQLHVASTAAITANSLLLLNENAPIVAPLHQRVVYVMSVVNATTLNVYDIGAGVSPIRVGGIALIKDDHVTWSDATRNNFPGNVPYPDATTAIDFYLSGSIYRLTTLSREFLALNQNIDSRATQVAQIAVAQAQIPVIFAQLVAWQALGVVGPGCMYNNAGMVVIKPQLTTRAAQVANRKAELITAIGAVNPGAIAGSFILTEGAIASKYQWINKLINKGYGSRAQIENMLASKSIMDQQSSAAQTESNDYSLVMRATRLTSDPDGTKTVSIEDATGWAANDTIYLIDEYLDPNTGLPPPGWELTGKILHVYPTDENGSRVDLSFDVPDSYTYDNLVRIYKLL